MICKQCEAEAMEIEESAEGGDEWQVQRKGKIKSTDQNLIGKTSTLMSIM